MTFLLWVLGIYGAGVLVSVAVRHQAGAEMLPAFAWPLEVVYLVMLLIEQLKGR